MRSIHSSEAHCKRRHIIVDFLASFITETWKKEDNVFLLV